jgi:hypothetical protein
LTKFTNRRKSLIVKDLELILGIKEREKVEEKIYEEGKEKERNKKKEGDIKRERKRKSGERKKERERRR